MRSFGACDLAGMVLEMLEMLEVLMLTMLLVLMLAILVGLSTLALSRAWAAGRSKETSRIRRWRSILRFGLRGHYLSASCERAPLRVLSSRCPIYEHTSLFVQAAASHVIGLFSRCKDHQAGSTGRVHTLCGFTNITSSHNLEKWINARLGYFGLSV